MRGTLVLPVTIATFAAIIVATLGATVTDLGPWYQSLAKPDWTPPDGLFPIIWTLVFALITVSGVTAWRAAPDRPAAQWVISLFALNAFLNITWSLLFFRLQRPDLAMAELVVLWLSIALLIFYCKRFSKLAAWLLVPYLIWVTVAGALNWSVVQLNGPFG
ncbi:TspO/MBR family protein [Erythrobacter sp. THAF29]|uniref:TspO/MBR family protein n=1 Tax=Erythrobacter sp. THAF29 TaxID=2587851 RepID=UPI001267AB83|nr:TspO/MBR family protein [Erythrobacter sp. THAF29]QFT78632.1 TspO/MBR family protein [Erythrobacter sp. THAF29]